MYFKSTMIRNTSVLCFIVASPSLAELGHQYARYFIVPNTYTFSCQTYMENKGKEIKK